MRTSELPLVPLLLCLCLGIGLGLYVKITIWLLVPLILITILGVYQEWKGINWPFWLLIQVLVIGLVLSLVLQPMDVPYGEYTLTGTVVTVSNLTGYQRVIAKVAALVSVSLHLPPDIPLSPGTRISFTGMLQKPQRARNPGQFCYASYLASLGVYWYMEPTVSEVQKDSFSLIAWLTTHMEHNLKPFAGKRGLVYGLVLGKRDLMSPTLVSQWQRLGIQHLLAISGMHIGILSLLLGVILTHLPLPGFWRSMLLGIVMFVYVLVSGGRPSAWRALLVACLALGATRLERPINPLHTWSLAGIILLLIQPDLLLSTGFQLSMTASGGILLYIPIITRITSPIPVRIRGVMQSLLVSVIAQLSLLPLIGWYFQELALLAPISTLCFLPIIVLTLIVGLLIGGANLPLGQLLLALNGLEVSLTEFLLPGAGVLQLPKPSLLFIISWYLIFTYIGWKLRQVHVIFPYQSLSKACLLVICCLTLHSLPQGLIRPLEVTVLDVGQGDAIFIRTPSGQTMLIDGGGDLPYWQERGRNVGLQRVLPFLEYQGVEELDLVVLTHPHEDHLYGLLAVLENVPVKRIIDSGASHTTVSYRRYLEYILDQNIEHRSVRAGEVLFLADGIKVEVWHPASLLQGTASDLNNNSLVLCLKYRGRSLLFTGDLDIEGQETLLDRGVEQVDWVKVPHHGSEAAWTERFYQEIDPTYAVISVGNNSFGHPSVSVINGLTERGVAVYRTDELGAVTFYLWQGRFFGPKGE